ncbi:unnamed protein product, partial [Callosobruchus maculatus]
MPTSPLPACSSASSQQDRQDQQEDEDLAQLGRWLERRPHLLEKWLKEQASQEVKQRVQQAVLPVGEERSLRNSEISSDVFQLWLAASPANNNTKRIQNVRPDRDYDSMEESELFMELIRDVANQLDIDVLCYKIIRNVSRLTRAERGSLFLARQRGEERYLVAKLFDVQHDATFEEAVRQSEEFRIPFGMGIAGAVALNKTILNIKDACRDARFKSEIDMRMDYCTNAVLCMPICNYEGDVIGVAQIVNKRPAGEFDAHDAELFQRYLTFCGIGVQNAQLFEVSILEYKRNQILLNLARSIFEEQNNLECLVSKIMREAQDLLKCERCAVYLLDLDCCEA